jgi:hypothetical protein
VTTRRQELLRAAREASQSYTHAKKQLADARAMNAIGVRTDSLMFLESREHVCHHAWARALEALTSCPN